MREGRRALLSQLLITDALRRWNCHCWQYCGHSHSMPCWIPLHHWFIYVLSVRPRLLQPCRWPSQVHAVPSRFIQSGLGLCLPSCVHVVSCRLVLRPGQRQRRAHELQCRHVQPSDASKQRVVVPAVPSGLVLRPGQRQRHAHELQHWNFQSAVDDDKQQRLSKLPTWYFQPCNRSNRLLRVRCRDLQYR